LDKADTHQIAPATANTPMTNNAGATSLLESSRGGAFAIFVRSGCSTRLDLLYRVVSSCADSPTNSA
jgi:hypothetical protein